MISIAGVYSGFVDKIPFGMAMNKGLTSHGSDARQSLDRRAARADQVRADRSRFVITHTVGLEDGPEMYNVFRNKQDSCIKVVLKPDSTR